jgi:hypothetical protein
MITNFGDKVIDFMPKLSFCPCLGGGGKNGYQLSASDWFLKGISIPGIWFSLKA